jgi:thymidylate kinase
MDMPLIPVHRHRRHGWLRENDPHPPKLEERFSLMSDYRYVFTREPGGTPPAEAVRDILLDDSLSGNASGKTQLLGFFYARSHHLEMIRKKRDAGFVVITDRFDGSTFAYQVYGESKSPEEQEELSDLFWGASEQHRPRQKRADALPLPRPPAGNGT